MAVMETGATPQQAGRILMVGAIPPAVGKTAAVVSGVTPAPTGRIPVVGVIPIPIGRILVVGPTVPAVVSNYHKVLHRRVICGGV